MRAITKTILKNVYLKPRTNYHYKKYLRSIKDDAPKKLQYNPKISIVVPLYNTPNKFFEDMVQSVLGQTYQNWELVLVNDNSSLKEIDSIARDYTGKDSRIVYKKLSASHHIAGATNEGIKIATGEFVSLLDHDDILRVSALQEVVRALNKKPNLDFIYTDEDQIGKNIHAPFQPYLKPDWNPDLLYTVNYITHFVTIRRTVLDKFGYEDNEYNGTQDWELFLRITRNIPDENIHHIAKPLYSWRVHDGSTAKSFDTKPYLLAAQKKAVETNLHTLGYKNFSVAQHEKYPGMWSISWQLTQEPTVAIIINTSLPKAAEDHLRSNTDYKNYTIYHGIKQKNINEIYAKDYLVLIDKDLNIKNANWLNELIGDAQRKEVGSVSARYTATQDVMYNVEQLVNAPAKEFISKTSQRTVSKNLYVSSRYNVPSLRDGVAIVATSKLKEVIDLKSAELSVPRISKRLYEAGYHNLYNPYIKVLK